MEYQPSTSYEIHLVFTDLWNKIYCTAKTTALTKICII